MQFILSFALVKEMSGKRSCEVQYGKINTDLNCLNCLHVSTVASN